MSNYSLNNVRRFIAHIDETDYWDMHLNTAWPGDGDLRDDCLSVVIDTSNQECLSGDEMVSLSEYFYEDACSNGLQLNNIGFTGVDNGLIHYNKDRITNKEFYNLYTKSTYEIPSGDTRLHLHKVYGNTCLYEYPTSINEDGSIKLNGGFYQGFFRSGNEYSVLPSSIGPDEEWNFVFDIKKVDYEPESNKTLNDKYPDNKGIFFYIGTRAENKWVYLYDDIPLSGTPFGVCCDEDDPNIFDLVESEMVLSSQTYTTDSGFELDSPNDDYIISDNKFLIFDRTRGGVTIKNYEGNEVAVITTKKHRFDENLFLYMNRTKSGYTVNNISELESGYTDTYQDQTLYNDIYNNALAFIINDDGSIGYKFLVKDCSASTEGHYSVLTGNSYSGIIDNDKWTKIQIKIKGFADGMKILFYINGKLKYITKQLPKLSLHMLDELAEKQEGVAYNISLGGGTQGLSETIMPEYELTPTREFPLEKNFAGTFIGDIRGFKFYTC